MRPLPERKARLLARIRARRAETVRQVEATFRPWCWIDQAWAAWQAVPPGARQAAGPVLRSVLKGVFPRASRWLRWVTLLAAVMRGMRRRGPKPATRQFA